MRFYYYSSTVHIISYFKLNQSSQNASFQHTVTPTRLLVIEKYRER